MSGMRTMMLRLLPGELAVWKLPPGEPIPVCPLEEKEFWSVTVTGEETSVVTRPELVPPGVACQAGWKCLETAGPLDFTMTGVLASLAAPLAGAGVSIFVVSTFNTDYLLIMKNQLNLALQVLKEAGHHLVLPEAH